MEREGIRFECRLTAYEFSGNTRANARVELPRFGGRVRAFGQVLSETARSVAVAGGLWESRSDFQGGWEGAGGWEGVAAFHAPAGLRPG